MNGTTRFAAPYDRTTLVLSAAVCLLLAAVGSQFLVIGVPLLLLVMGLGYGFSPRGYEISSGAVTVRRLLGNVRIPLDGVRAVRRATADDLHGAMRLMGSGGLFGYYGLFRTSKLGKCTWYVTDRSRMVVLITDAKTVALSPDDPDAFVTALRPFAPALDPAGAELPPALSGAGGWPVRGIVIGLALAIVGGVFAFALFYAPGPPSFTLTPQGLTIHARPYSTTVEASSVDVAGVRVVDLGQDSPWRPTRRTNGVGMRHYHVGWFRVAGGQTVRLYRADARRLVLLPPKGDGAPVLFEARDPDALVRQLRQEWGS